MKTYYRLLCLQGTGYMATGFNSTSLYDLASAYASYKETDWEDEMVQAWERMSLEDRVKEIEADEFEVESSNKPFDEADIH